ncbi:MAG TPA: chromosome condensation protein CrcB, partial [Brevibacterium sp.]|nr:chromosome condensation protein CrcB [Brevibacterium sp.]
GFPWGILIVNVSGSLLLGLLIGTSAALVSPALTMFGTGFLGGYTTFSTAMVDTLALVRQGRHREAWANGAGMLVLCVAVAVFGMVIGRAL